MTTAAGVGGERFQIFGELAEGGRDPRVFEDFGVAEKVCVAQPDKFSAPEQRRGSRSLERLQNGFFCVFRLLRGAVYDLFGHFVERVFRQFLKNFARAVGGDEVVVGVIKYAALLSIAFKFFPAAGFVNINFDIEIF